MPSYRFSITDVIAGGAVFGLIAAIVLIGAVVWWRRRSQRAQKLQRRLGLPQPSPRHSRVLRLWQHGREVTTTVPSEDAKPSLPERMDRLRREAGWKVPVQTLVLALLGLTGIALAAALVLSKSILISLVAGATVAAGLWAYARRRARQRMALFERQLVDAMQLAARSLRAGHPLLAAFRLIADELDDPISTVFANVCQQQEMGVSLQSALQQVGAECASPDMKLFATSVTIQLRSGGNLADMMDRVAFVIRERIRLGRRVRVLTAQTQFSKRVLLALPFVLFLLLNIVNPGYMETLYATSTGKFVLALAGGGMLVGAWTMNRLARIRW